MNILNVCKYVVKNFQRVQNKLGAAIMLPYNFPLLGLLMLKFCIIRSAQTPTSTFAGHANAPDWSSMLATAQQLIDKLRQENEAFKLEVDALKSQLDESMIQRQNDAEEIVRLRMENDRLRDEHKREIDQITTDHKDALNRVIVIGCTCTGGLGIMLFCVVWLIFRCKKKTKLRTQSGYRENPRTMVRVQVEDEVIPGQIQHNRSPIFIDEGGKFGMNDIYGVTPRAGADLVRIARPLETARASRILSEALMDIQPIVRDEEGRKCSVLNTTSPGEVIRGSEGQDPLMTELKRKLNTMRPVD